jgi:hypothetical protein
MRSLSLLIIVLLVQAPVRPSGLSGIVVKQDTVHPFPGRLILQSDGVQTGAIPLLRRMENFRSIT